MMRATLQRIHTHTCVRAWNRAYLFRLCMVRVYNDSVCAPHAHTFMSLWSVWSTYLFNYQTKLNTGEKNISTFLSENLNLFTEIKETILFKARISSMPNTDCLAQKVKPCDFRSQLHKTMYAKKSNEMEKNIMIPCHAKKTIFSKNFLTFQFFNTVWKIKEVFDLGLTVKSNLFLKCPILLFRNF